MSTTIFCSFDQQDLADLAVGRLRASSLDIRSIHYIGGFRPEGERPITASTAAVGFAGTLTPQVTQAPVGVFDVSGPADPPMPAPPVTIKIVCPDSAAAAVKSKLINMNAYQIITTR